MGEELRKGRNEESSDAASEANEEEEEEDDVEVEVEVVVVEAEGIVDDDDEEVEVTGGVRESRLVASLRGSGRRPGV